MDGVWGIPYSPCSCNAVKKKHDKLNTFYHELNRVISKPGASIYMKNFRLLALITILVVAAFVYQDVARKMIMPTIVVTYSRHKRHASRK